MQSLTNRSKLVSNKKMTLSERLYIPAILAGLRITIYHFFKKKATIQYPEQQKISSKKMNKVEKIVQLVDCVL